MSRPCINAHCQFIYRQQHRTGIFRIIRDSGQQHDHVRHFSTYLWPCCTVLHMLHPLQYIPVALLYRASHVTSTSVHTCGPAVQCFTCYIHFSTYLWPCCTVLHMLHPLQYIPVALLYSASHVTSTSVHTCGPAVQCFTCYIHYT